MGQQPKIRLNFNADVAYLIRMEEAIARDPRLTPDQKRRLSDRISGLKMEMMTIDAERAA